MLLRLKFLVQAWTKILLVRITLTWLEGFKLIILIVLTQKLNKMIEKAQKLFGMGFHGLNIDQCDYSTFEEWYNSTHTRKCTQEVYDCACFIWNNCERR